MPPPLRSGGNICAGKPSVKCIGSLIILAVDTALSAALDKAAAVFQVAKTLLHNDMSLVLAACRSSARATLAAKSVLLETACSSP